MVDLKVGMYLRHKGLEGEYPIIQKITKLQKLGRCGAKYNVYTDKCLDWFIDSDYIDTGTYNDNILDLIEVGDLMYLDISPDDCNGIVVPRITETQYELNNYKEVIKSKKYVLKSIVTHEQLKNARYKVKK